MSSVQQTILISEPTAHSRNPFFPYMWAILKTYSERIAHLEGVCKWLEPIYQKDEAETLLQPYLNSPPDVLGLSCYIWNWDLQCEIARSMKARNPDCLVVAGGPHPDYKDPDFFRKHPYLDIVVVKDGEITFSKILETLIHGGRDFSNIGGLYLPGADHDGSISTGPAEVPTVFDYSPYLEQRDFYDKLVERHGPKAFDATWETNRGCPYSCSFCDWGSNTMSKIRRFDLDRVEAEIDWFARMEIPMLFLADANFGILPRDLEIADVLIEARKKHGYPKFLCYSTAKNNPERTVEIAKKFAVTRVSSVHTISLQHTNPEVLAATDRANISLDKQRQVIKELLDHDVPTDVQLILGIPGDTYDLWKNCLADLMEWGLHEDYYIFDYCLLPNAPAADRDFIQRWEIETIKRRCLMELADKRHKDDIDALTPGIDLIVKTKTFSRDDWVKMKAYGQFVKALHCCSVTRLIAMYLRFTHNVTYRDFYEHLIEDCISTSTLGLYSKVLHHFEQFLEDDDAVKDLEIQQLSRDQYCIEASRWIFIHICDALDTVFDEITAFLRQRYPWITNLESVIDYQKNLIITPSYDRSVGKSFPTEFDWTSYFAKASSLISFEHIPEPNTAPGSRIEITDKTCGTSDLTTRPLDWSSEEGEDRWAAWIDRVVTFRNAASTKNFQQLRLRPYEPHPVRAG